MRPDHSRLISGARCHAIGLTAADSRVRLQRASSRICGAGSICIMLARSTIGSEQSVVGRRGMEGAASALASELLMLLTRMKVSQVRQSRICNSGNTHTDATPSPSACRPVCLHGFNQSQTSDCRLEQRRSRRGWLRFLHTHPTESWSAPRFPPCASGRSRTLVFAMAPDCAVPLCSFLLPVESAALDDDRQGAIEHCRQCSCGVGGRLRKRALAPATAVSRARDGQRHSQQEDGEARAGKRGNEERAAEGAHSGAQ